MRSPMRPDTLQWAGSATGIGGRYGCARTVPGAAAGTRSAAVTARSSRASRRPTSDVHASGPAEAEGLPAVTVPNSNRPASVPPMVFIRLPPRRAPRGCRAMQHLSESRWPDGALVSSARPDSTTWQSIQAGPGPRASAVHCNWREHWKGRHHRGWCPCGAAGSERVFGRQAHQRGGALGTLDLRAAVDVDQRAGLGAMVVIVQADAEVLGGVPARADAGIPAAAVRIAAAAHAQILA